MIDEDKLVWRHLSMKEDAKVEMI